MAEQKSFKDEIIKFLIDNDKTLNKDDLNNLAIVQLVIMKTELEINKNLKNILPENNQNS